YNTDFFARTLPIGRPGLNLRIDNYYSRGGAGVGDVANGPVYNHPELINPNDLDDTFLIHMNYYSKLTSTFMIKNFSVPQRNR
ncbi:MAG: hypothetical protein G01um101466_584, partial [Parcubacteria group bacterium Gr01-1014_66]